MLARAGVFLVLLAGLEAGAPAAVIAQRPPAQRPPAQKPPPSPELQRAQQLQTEAAQRLSRGEYQNAIPGAREALALREGALGPDHPGVAETLQTLASLLRETAQYAEARPLYERALAIREKTHGADHPAVAWVLSELGVLLVRTGDYAAARPMLERSLAIREKAFGPVDNAVAASLSELGFLFHSSGDLAAARPLWERALRVREQAVGPTARYVGNDAANLGRLYRDTGQYPAARPLLDRALQIRENVLGPDHPDVAISLDDLGWLLYLTGDYVAARPLYERALQIRERRLGPNHPFVARTLITLAISARTAGDYAAARPLLDRALAIREQALGPAHPDVAGALRELGYLSYWTGDYSAARSFYDRALAIREAAQGPGHPAVGRLLNDHGVLLAKTGDMVGARRAYERSIAITEQSPGSDPAWLAWPLNNYGRLLRLMGDYAGARALLERSLQLRERSLGPDHPDVAFSLLDLGSVFLPAKAYDKVRPLYERALAIRERAFGRDHPQVADALVALGYLERLTRRHAEARAVYDRALRIREAALAPDHADIAWVVNFLGAVARETGDHAAAAQLFERALPTVRRVQVPELRWRVTTGLGRAYESLGRPADALPLLRDAVATLESMAAQFEDDAGRTQFLQAEDRLVAYEALARVLLKLHESESSAGYDRDAWAVLEAKKGRVVAEALAAARKDLTTVLAQTKGEYLAQTQAFLARHAADKARFVDQQTVDPKALAKFADRLPAGTLAVQYFASAETLYLFVVAPGGRFQVKSRAVKQEALYGLIKEYRRHLDAASTEALPWVDDGSQLYRDKVSPLREVGRKLSALLLEPVAAELKTHRNLVLIPNDLLLYLPIHALPLEDGIGPAKFLAETHAVSFVTQLELVDLLVPSAAGVSSPLLALANPDGTLPAASREVRELARLRAGSTALEGAQATKAKFLALAGQFSDVHLATHGVLDTERPERSYLLMAGPDEESRHLSIGEIASLTLARNGLAVLSACETALGEQVPGSALITLAAAFSQAGAQSVVASLWKVNDAATRDFMVAFHRALGSAGRAAALQQAQLAVLRQSRTAHPYYWAPFILIGAR